MSFGFFRNLTKPKPSPVQEREHVVAGRTLPLRIVESARARRLTLRIDSGGQGLRITVPPGLRRGEVEKFLHRHQDWLEQRLAKVPTRPQVRPGIRIPIRGVARAAPFLFCSLVAFALLVVFLESRIVQPCPSASFAT